MLTDSTMALMSHATRMEERGEVGAPGFLSNATSQPVSIPSRSQRARVERKPSRGKGSLRRASTTSSTDKHKPDAISPSVAALLAVTSIPPHRRARLQNGSREGSKQKSGVVRERELPVSCSPRTVMDVLLSPPEDDERLGFADFQTRGEREPESLSSRSVSFDSVPSLDTDEGTLSPETSGIMSSPSSGRRRSSYEQRKRSYTVSKGEDCACDHPLLANGYGQTALRVSGKEHSTNHTGQHSYKEERSGRPLSRKSSSLLSSNLTASFRVLRSAARSFSNFAASTTASTHFVTPEDYITRSVLSISPQFTDERRPLPLREDPTPALRRYLNPTTTPSLLDDPHTVQQYNPSQPRSNEITPFTASIQLQTYRRCPIPRRTSSIRRTTAYTSPSATLDPLTPPLPAGPELAPWPARRENRENSDFLRVIVCEMNMRRAGKLADDAPGKARFVLPPRRVSLEAIVKVQCDGSAAVDGQNIRRRSSTPVPSRWRDGKAME